MRRVILLILVVISLSIAARADRKAELDWRADPLMIANVSLSARSIALKDVCRRLERQTSAEFFADRRFADVATTIQISSTKLETVMTCIEEITGLQWRLVDDMFFLTEDARGTAVVRWKERYQEARKSELAATTETGVQQWLYDTMPFPPAFDPEWELTPLQREQIAYGNTLSVFTMTPPQIAWLNQALRAGGFRTTAGAPTDILVRESPDLAVRLSAAMVIDSPQGPFVVEKPLTIPAPKPAEPTPAKPVKIDTPTSQAEETPKKSALKGNLEGIWLTGGESGDLTTLLRTAKDRQFNNLFVPVLSAGQTIYPSKVLHPDETPSGPDRLKQIIGAAGKLGMKVHAVLDTTLWGDSTHPAPQAARYSIVQDRNLLDRSFSEQEKWQRAELNTLKPDVGEETPPLPPTEESVYLCPASSQTSRLVKAIAREIASNYAVAGICLDRLEYPQGEPFVVNGRDMSIPFGYTIEVRKEMIRANQLDPIDLDPQSIRTPSDLEAQAAWDKFRRGKLTGLITDVSAEFKAVRPEGICSVSLDLASDAQSPGHWAQIADLDALLPAIDLAATGKQSDFQATNALYAALSKYAAIVPVIRGSDMEGFIDLASALKPPKPDRGWILSGDSSELVKTLEGLLTAGDQ